jgi:hypothetical protein
MHINISSLSIATVYVAILNTIIFVEEENNLLCNMILNYPVE